MDKTHKVKTIIQSLGGGENILDISCCTTRLRIILNDIDLFNEEKIRTTKCFGVIKKENMVQIVYGFEAYELNKEIQKIINNFSSHNLDKNISVNENIYITMEKLTNLNNIDKITSLKDDKNTHKKISGFILITSPMTGEVMPICASPDEAISNGLLGDGCIIVPEDGIVVCPCKAIINFVFPTLHAIGLILENNIELLIHIGIDTFDLGGIGFKSFVKEGQIVEKGEKLLEFDLEYIRNSAPSLSSAVLCTSLNENKIIKILKKGRIKRLENLLKIE